MTALIRASDPIRSRGVSVCPLLDPRSYGTAARQNALKGGFSKSDTYVAHEMVRWYGEQLAHDRAARDIFVPAAPTFAFQRPPNRAMHSEVGSPGCR
jgi:hypothetical protein